MKESLQAHDDRMTRDSRSWSLCLISLLREVGIGGGCSDVGGMQSVLLMLWKECGVDVVKEVIDDTG
jgi:hypothetical protein